MSFLWPAGAPKINYISNPPSHEFIAKPRRRLAILGSTGSIGQNAFKIAMRTQDRLHVVALGAGRNISLLAEQAAALRPGWLAVAERDLIPQLRKLLPSGYNPEILSGRAGAMALASLPEADSVLSAQSGSAGLAATLAAAFSGKVIALANKESLVTAGGLIRKICAQSGASILPVDSEHFAIFQCAAGRGQNVKSIILTASGGPFLHKSKAEIDNATPEVALKHPNWNMGRKISIDSATMMNKGLELIEAMHLYGVEPAQIQILIHSQSIVHSLVEFEDNSQLGQFAIPDMKLAIAGCLLWPDCQQSFIPRLDLAQVGELDFLAPDMDKFRCISLAIQCARFQPSPAWRGTGLNPACIALNGANEAAVESFLSGACQFGEIAARIEKALIPWLNQEGAPPADFKPDPDSILNLIDSISAQAKQIALS